MYIECGKDTRLPRIIHYAVVFQKRVIATTCDDSETSRIIPSYPWSPTP